MSNPLLKNQAFYNESGFIRRIALDKTGRIRPVVRADKRPAEDARAGTYQQVEEDDTIIQYSKKSDTLSFLQATIIDDEVRTKPLSEGFDFKPVVNTIDLLMTKWLEENQNKPWLPPGFGWDGKYSQTDVIKITSAIARLPDQVPMDMLERITNAIYFTPNERVNVEVQYISPSEKAMEEIMSTLEDNESFLIEWCNVDGNTSDVNIEPLVKEEELVVFQNTTDFCILEFVPLKTDEQLRWKFYKVVA